MKRAGAWILGFLAGLCLATNTLLAADNNGFPVPGPHEIGRLPLSDPASTLELSSDGKMLFVGDHKGFIWVWNVPERKLISKFQPHPYSVRSILLRPTQYKIVTACGDGYVGFWNSNDFAKQNELNIGKDVWDMDLSPDGKQITFVRKNSSAIVVDVASGNTLHEIQATTEERGFLSVVFVDAKHLLIQGENSASIRRISDGSIKARLPFVAHDVKGGQLDTTGKWFIANRGKASAMWPMAEVRKAIASEGTASEIRGVVPAWPNELSARAIAKIPFDSWSFGGTAKRAVNPEVGILFPPLPEEPDVVNVADVSTDGLTAVVAGYNPWVRIWDLRALKQSDEWEFGQGYGPEMAHDRKHSLIAVGSPQGGISIFNYAQKELVGRANVDQQKMVWPAPLTFRDGKLFGILSEWKAKSETELEAPPKIVIRNLETGDLAGQAPVLFDSSARIRASPDGRFIVMAGSNPGYRIIGGGDVQRGEWPQTERISALILFDQQFKEIGDGFAGHLQTGVKRTCFSPTAKLIVTQDESGLVRLFDTLTQKKIGEFQGNAQAMDVASTDEGLIVQALFGSLFVYNGRTGERTATLETAHQRAIKSIAISPNGEVLGTLSEDRTIRLWKLPDLKSLGSFGLSDFQPGQMLFLSDEMLAYAGERFRLLKVSDARNLSGNNISGFPQLRMHIDISRDGKVIAAGGYDGAVWLIDREQRQPIKQIAAEKNEISKVAFLGNTHRFVSLGNDGIKLWDLESSDQPIANLNSIPENSNLFVSPNGEFLVVTQGAQAGLWKVKEMKQLSTISYQEPEIRFSKDGSKVAFVSGLRGQSYDLASGSPIEGKTITPDAFDVGPLTKGGQPLILTLTSGKRHVNYDVCLEIARFDHGQQSVYLFDRNQVAVIGNNHLWIYSLDRASFVWGYKMQSYVNDIAYDVTRQELLTTDSDGTIRIWKLPPKAKS